MSDLTAKHNEAATIDGHRESNRTAISKLNRESFGYYGV
jgi:hypothetical protein